ncbi:MAG: PorT family protein [Prevotella sp.]|nr:PorT family protein [Prevotella sp.]
MPHKLSSPHSWLLLLLLMLTTPSMAQRVRFGFKGGVDVATMSLNRDVLKSDNRLGFFIGPTLTSDVPFTGLGFDISVLYNQREAKVYDEFHNTDNLKQKQVVIPLNARYSVALGDFANIFVSAGPQVGFTVGDDVQDLDEMIDRAQEWRLKKSNFSINVGGGFTVGHIQISANYNVGVGKTGDATWGDAWEAAKDGWNGRYNAWQIGVAYLF